jgi:anti-sigma-K factor RskA
MTMNSDEHVIQDIPAFALGSLDLQTARQVARHVAACRACREELREYEALTDQLLDGIAPTQAPTRVQDLILAQISKSQHDRARASVPLPPKRGPIGFAVAAVVVLFLAVAAFLALSPVSTAAELQVLSLTGASDLPEVTGVLIVSANGDLGTLVVDHLPPLGEGMKYQIWLKHGESLEAGQTFGISDSGYWGGHVRSADSLLSYDWFGVTMEPEAGSAEPTSAVLLEGVVR